MHSLFTIGDDLDFLLVAAERDGEVEFIACGKLEIQFVRVIRVGFLEEFQNLCLRVGSHHNSIPLLETERVVEGV